MHIMLYNGYQTISDDCHTYLYPDCILGSTPKLLYFEMQFQPFEEKSLLIKISDIKCRYMSAFVRKGTHAYPLHHKTGLV